jgi:catecholate siderophore receptor
MYVGGYIDLQSKRPYFDATKGTVSVTLGNYDTKRWTVDIGGPISKATAYRFSYSGEDSKGFYHDGFKKTHSIYGALAFRPNSTYDLFLNAQIFLANYTENWGINRVTQDLIDNGNYITGTNVNGGTVATAADPQNAANIIAGGNTIAWGPTVKINRHVRLLKPGNDSNGREYNAQAIQTFKVSPTLTVKNTSFASYTKRDTISTYYYS